MPGTHARRPSLAVPDDAELAHLLHNHVDDLLTWLDDYPADQVDPTAVARALPVTARRRRQSGRRGLSRKASTSIF
jgi:hypothetical protein